MCVSPRCHPDTHETDTKGNLLVLRYGTVLRVDGLTLQSPGLDAFTFSLRFLYVSFTFPLRFLYVFLYVFFTLRLDASTQGLDASNTDEITWRVDAAVDLGGSFGTADSSSSFTATAVG